VTRSLAKQGSPKSGWQNLPPIIDESLVGLFKFWDRGIQAGMLYNGEIYALFQSYPLGEQLKACAIACEYTERGVHVCITASKIAYSIWLSLHSLQPISASPDPGGSIVGGNVLDRSISVHNL
jgi:hypothetical protein